MIDNPGGSLIQRLSASYSEWFPIMRRPKDLAQKVFLWPVITTLALATFVISDPQVFGVSFGIYFCFLTGFIVYRLCGKRKSLALIVLIALVSAWLVSINFPIFVLGPIFGLFTGSLPNPQWVEQQAAVNALSFPLELWVYSVRVGLSEELTKAAPLLLLLFLGPMLPAKWEGWRISEPLDGILLGVASGIGFSFIETTFIYLPAAVSKAGVTQGMELEQIRLLEMICVHCAYSGLFGYFIGLAALRRTDKIRLLLVGWLTASLLHGVWDTLSVHGRLLSFPVGILSYVMFGAALLKARQISPARGNNFTSWTTPTRRVDPSEVATPPVNLSFSASPASDPTPPATMLAVLSPPVASTTAARFLLRIGDEAIPLCLNASIRRGEIPFLAPPDDQSLMAMVVARPDNPDVLGLQNLSAHPWMATLKSGKVRDVVQDAVIRLDEGIVLRFGDEGRAVVEVVAP